MIEISGSFRILVNWVNQGPKWLTTQIEFMQGIAQDKRFDMMVADADGDAIVAIDLQDRLAVQARLAPFGVSFSGLGTKDATIRYDGRDLGAKEGEPFVIEDAFRATADDGRSVGTAPSTGG